jgi:CelD/BcsL family acetyltransferase involved in cellulose biosynthesis
MAIAIMGLAEEEAGDAAAGERFDIVDTPEAFAALRGEWERLCARVPGHYLGQTFDWAWACWRTVAAPRGRRLACVVGRSGARLVLVWPLAIDRDGWGGSIARPLDSETSEYSAVLVEDGPDAERRVRAALALLRGRRVCDRLELPNVHADTALERVLASQHSRTQAMRTGSMDAAWVSWKGIGSWEQYLDGLDSHERRELRRKTRRLQECGELSLEVVTDPAGGMAALDWSLAQKLPWLEKTGRRNAWIGEPEHRAFLAATLAAFAPSGRRIVFVLKLKEEIIATLLVSVDRVRTEWFFCAAHPGYARFSPAQVLRERALHWAFDHGLDCDLRIGEQRFKGFWCNRIAHTCTWLVANSARGRAALLALQLRKALLARLPPRVRSVLRTWAGRAPPPSA